MHYDESEKRWQFKWLHLPQRIKLDARFKMELYGKNEFNAHHETSMFRTEFDASGIV